MQAINLPQAMPLSGKAQMLVTPAWPRGFTALLPAKSVVMPELK